MRIQMRDRGQITLPQNVRKELKLNTGSFLKVTILGSSILLTGKAKQKLQDFEQMQKIAQENLQGKKYTVGQILDDLDEIRQENWNKLYARAQNKSAS